MRYEVQTPQLLLLTLNYHIFSNFSLGNTHFEVHFFPTAQLSERQACLFRLFTQQLKNNSKKSLQKR